MGSFTGEEEILSGLMIAHGDMLYIDCVYNVLKKIHSMFASICRRYASTLRLIYRGVQYLLQDRL